MSPGNIEGPLLPQPPTNTPESLVRLPQSPAEQARLTLAMEADFQRLGLQASMPESDANTKRKQDTMKTLYGAWGHAVEAGSADAREALRSLKGRLSGSGIPESVQKELAREMDKLIHDGTGRPLDPYSVRASLAAMRGTLQNLFLADGSTMGNRAFIDEMIQTLGSYEASFYVTRPLAYNLPASARPFAPNDRRGREILRMGGFLASALLGTGALVMALFQAKKTGKLELGKAGMFLVPGFLFAAGPSMLAPASQRMREQIGGLADPRFSRIAARYGLQGEAGATTAKEIWKADPDTKKLLALTNPTEAERKKIAEKIPGLQAILHDTESYKLFVTVIQQARTDESRAFAEQYLREKVSPQDLAVLAQAQPVPIV